VRNTITTITTINETTSDYTSHASLYDLLAQRAQQRDAEERIAAQQRELDADDRAEDAITQLEDVLRERLSAQTYDALQLTYGYARNDDDQDLEHAYVNITHDSAVWTLQYINGYWQLTGPNGYTVQIGYNWHGHAFDSKLLDAIDGYPAWMELKTAQQDAGEPQRTKSALPQYRYTTGGESGATSPGLLHINAHVTVWMIPTDGREYPHPHYTGRVDSYDDRWLLLTCDGPAHRQRLIPIARIDEILPEMPYAKTPETKPALDDIPF